MKFTYYSKKSNTEGVCFFTIRTDNDDEAFRINALTRKYEMYTLFHFDCEVGVFDESITNIQSARKLYNQIKQEAMNLKEDELVQRYYFTDDCEEVFECFATPEEAYNKAKELANEYNSIIYVNTVVGEEIVDCVYPDERETEDTPEQLEAPAPVQPEDKPVPEQKAPVYENEFDRSVCRCCKHCIRMSECDKVMTYDVFSNATEEMECRCCSGDYTCCPNFLSESFSHFAFLGDEHCRLFFRVICRMELKPHKDPYREALAYLITLDFVCRQHIDDLYDFEEHCIKPDCLYSPWQTSTSRYTTVFAFNLFTGHLGWCPEEFKVCCTPSDVFCCSYAPYYWEAIKIRYPDYTRSHQKTEPAYELNSLSLADIEEILSDGDLPF